MEGIISYMVVIDGYNRSIPLSKDIRYDIWNGLFEFMDTDNLSELKNDFDLIDVEYETIIDYIVKLPI